MLEQVKHLDEKQNLNPYLIPYVEISTKWIIDLNMNFQTIKHLKEKNIGENICDLGLGKDFLDIIQKKRKYFP